MLRGKSACLAPRFAKRDGRVVVGVGEDKAAAVPEEEVRTMPCTRLLVGPGQRKGLLA